MSISKDLIEKYFKNQASEREVRKVLRWFKTEEGRVYLERRFDKEIEDFDDAKWLSVRPVDTSKMLHSIYAADSSAIPGTTSNIETPNRFAWYFKVAASLAVIAVCVSVFFIVTSDDSITYKTKYGEKKEIVLPDSSKVILNGNSSLTLSSEWSNLSKREVWLQGEAFFSVFHTQNNNDFIVYTSDNLNIQVLGTEFNVLNRENITKVALERGNVRLNFTEKGKGSKLTMRPGELVEFNTLSAFLIKKETHVETITSWKEPSMVFEQTSIKEIGEMLKDTYGLTLIVNEPSILDQKITGTVPNENLDLFLEGLTEILEVKITREQNLVYLKQ